MENSTPSHFWKDREAVTRLPSGEVGGWTGPRRRPLTLFLNRLWADDCRLQNQAQGHSALPSWLHLGTCDILPQAVLAGAAALCWQWGHPLAPVLCQGGKACRLQGEQPTAPVPTEWPCPAAAKAGGREERRAAAAPWAPVSSIRCHSVSCLIQTQVFNIKPRGQG